MWKNIFKIIGIFVFIIILGFLLYGLVDYIFYGTTPAAMNTLGIARILMGAGIIGATAIFLFTLSTRLFKVSFLSLILQAIFFGFLINIFSSETYEEFQYIINFSDSITYLLIPFIFGVIYSFVFLKLILIISEYSGIIITRKRRLIFCLLFISLFLLSALVTAMIGFMGMAP